MVITIDGPAASGKSSVSRELARRLGWNWVSTGAFYRGLAYVALQKHIDLNDVNSLVSLIADPVWSVRLTPQKTSVIFKDQDVTEQIAHEEVGNYASKISHYPEVRQMLLNNQRVLSEGPDGLIAEGRDCGTVVFPEAKIKVYLTASSENRAARRAAELGLEQKDLVEAQKKRDEQDSTRKAAPLQIPENALVLDSTTLSLNEVVEKVEFFVKNKLS